jgi:hypothetical protein
MNIQVLGARGGHGATTVSFLLGRMLKATIHDQARNDGFDCGSPTTSQHYMAWEIPDQMIEHSATHGIYDCGPLQADSLVREEDSFTGSKVPEWTGPIDLSIIVLRGPDYIGLRTIVRALPQPQRQPLALLVIEEDGRSLKLSDAELITGIPAFGMTHDHAIARAVDAGLLAHRHPLSKRFNAATHEISILMKHMERHYV